MRIARERGSALKASMNIGQGLELQEDYLENIHSSHKTSHEGNTKSMVRGHLGFNLFSFFPLGGT